MNVRELVGLLQKCDQSAQVLVWDPFHDCESANVHVSVRRSGEVDIGTTAFGREVLPDELAGPNVRVQPLP